MSHNPFSGKVPIHLRTDAEKLEKAASADYTSFRSGKKHPVSYRNQYHDKSIEQRNTGCTILRRYPNGKLDFQFVAHEIISLLHKIQDGGNLTNFEKACLTIILPDRFSALIDHSIAQTMTKLSDEEKMMVAMLVGKHVREELNYNAGYGGGSVPGRGQTRS